MKKRPPPFTFSKGGGRFFQVQEIFYLMTLMYGMKISSLSMNLLADLGKSHEAMLVITQKWLEGQRRILLAIPNADLLFQWTELFDKFYSVPYYKFCPTAANGKPWSLKVNPTRSCKMRSLSLLTSSSPTMRKKQKLCPGI